MDVDRQPALEQLARAELHGDLELIDIRAGIDGRQRHLQPQRDTVPAGRQRPFDRFDRPILGHLAIFPLAVIIRFVPDLDMLDAGFGEAIQHLVGDRAGTDAAGLAQAQGRLHADGSEIADHPLDAGARVCRDAVGIQLAGHRVVVAHAADVVADEERADAELLDLLEPYIPVRHVIVLQGGAPVEADARQSGGHGYPSNSFRAASSSAWA